MRWRPLRVLVWSALLGVFSSVAAPAQEADGAPFDLASVPVPLIDALDDSTRALLETARAEAQTAASEQTFTRLCLLYLRYEFSDSAAPCLAQMRRRYPDDYRWSYYQLLVADRIGDLELSRALIEEVRRLAPDDVPTILRSGDLHLALGQVDQAESDYRRALELAPRSPAAGFGLGRVLAEKGQPAAAIEWFEAALVSQPPGSIVHHHLGMAYRQLGDLESAKTELSRNRQVPVAMTDPLLVIVNGLGLKREELFDQAARMLANDQPQEALEILESLLEVSPNDAEVHLSAARALVDLSRPADAERHLRRAVELDPNYGEAHFNLGMLLGRTGRRAEAGRSFERAAEVGPENARWRTTYAQSLAERGDFEAAIRELEDTLELDRGLIEPRQILGAMAVATGRHALAAEQFDQLLELTPGDPQVHYGLALSLFQSGSFARAAAVLEAGVAQFPGDPALSHLLARLLATAPDPALRDGQRALRLAQALVERQLTLDHAETLAMALAEVGRFDEAATWQQRVLDQVSSNQDSRQGSVPVERQRQIESRLELYRSGRAVRF